MSLKDLTVVIPIYNRGNFLLRQIDYWKNSDAKILLMDGSDEPLPDEVLSSLSSNIFYRHSRSEFNERLVLACEFINTKYSVLLHDDEIFIMDGLMRCVDHLEADNRLIGCQGRSIYFFNRENNIIAHECYEKAKDVPGLYLDAITRVKNAFPNGDPSHAPYALYSVMKSAVWKDLINLSYSKRFSSGYVYELAFQIAAHAIGPIQMLDFLYWMRSGENPKQTSAAVNRAIGTGAWGTSPRYLDEYEDFVKRVTELIADYHVGTMTECESVVREVSQKFFVYSLRKPRRPIAHWRRFVGAVINLTPSPIKKLVKENMTTPMGRMLDYRGVLFDDALDDLYKRGISYDEDEMMEIKNFLNTFHRKLAEN